MTLFDFDLKELLTDFEKWLPQIGLGDPMVKRDNVLDSFRVLPVRLKPGPVKYLSG